MCKRRYPTVLAIAGSDSIAGAGIQADIKTCMALGAYAMTVVTAITAQNTTGVKSSMSVPADVLRAQLDAVLDDVRPVAVKIGMLPTPEAVRIVAEAIESRRLANVVVDPVWVSTSGFALVSNEVPRLMREHLLAQATVVTPNRAEATLLLGREIADVDAPSACTELREKIGCKSLLLKGGHFSGSLTVDYLAAGDKLYSFASERIDTPNSHGTGCTLSSAIAALLARDRDVVTAVQEATDYVHAAIAKGAEFEMGNGAGPLNHSFNYID